MPSARRLCVRSTNIEKNANSFVFLRKKPDRWSQTEYKPAYAATLQHGAVQALPATRPG